MARIVQPLSMSYYCDVTFLLKQSSNLPGWVVETGLVDPLDHLWRQDGGQLVGNPAGQLAPRVRVGHIAQGAGGPAQGRHQEPCHDGDGQCQDTGVGGHDGHL